MMHTVLLAFKSARASAWVAMLKCGDFLPMANNAHLTVGVTPSLSLRSVSWSAASKDLTSPSGVGECVLWCVRVEYKTRQDLYLLSFCSVNACSCLKID